MLLSQQQVMKKIVRLIISIIGSCLLFFNNSYGIDTRVIERTNHFVVVVPSYNNKAYYRENLDSIVGQQYVHFHVLYIDDASTDGTPDLVQDYIDEHKLHDKITLVRNQERRLKLYNMYHGIRTLPDHSIVVEVDGDDTLAHNNVLGKLNQVYQDPRIWLTYGQFIMHPSQEVGRTHNVPREVVASNSFRSYPWSTSHLKTYYVWLFKKIDQKDLMHNGAFYRSTADQAYMYPMLEMAGLHSRFIKDILYIYNMDTPLNDFKVDSDLQIKCESLIKQGRRYAPLRGNQIKK